MDPADTLDELLLRTRDGDQAAFARFYEATASRMFGLCLRMLDNNRADAEEALQEIYTTVWRRAGTFDPALARATTWLTALGRNKVIDRLRQQPRERQHDAATELETLPDDAPSPQDMAQMSDEYRRLRECMDQLDPHQQQSVREAFFTGLTYNDLATRRSVPLGTMKSWIRRALMQLRACLES